MDCESHVNFFSLIMKTIIYIFTCLVCCNTVVSQPNPEPKKVAELFFPDDETLEEVTPAFQKKKGFTNYEELISFLNTQQKQHPELVTIDFIGKSQKGYDIPIMYINNKEFSSEGKVKIWYQGGLHGNEMATTESMLYIIYKLLNDSSLAYLLEKIEIAIVPMANIDGYLKSDRYSANGIDLNRDQTKLMAPESIVLKQTFNAFQPEVAIDFHEYNPYRRDFAKLGKFGITSAFDAMFLYSSNPNVPKSIRDLTDKVFVENARNVLDQHQYRHRDYVSTETYSGEIHFNSGGTSSRSSSSSFALSNAVAMVMETRGIRIGRNSFKRRIKVTYLVGLSFMQTAYDNIDLLKNTLKTSRDTKQKIALETKKRIYKDTIKAIDLDDYKLIDLPVTIRDVKGLKITLDREPPQAYVLSQDLDYLIEKIKVLGLQVDTLKQDTTYNVETYTIIEYNRDEKQYEKMNLQHVKTKLETKTITFPKGSFIVNTDQKNAGLLYEVLEPEGRNSFVSFGVLETALNQELPIYRISSKN